MIRLYGVLDADGVKLNTITADEELIATDWYPGYGAYLVDEGENPPDPPPVKPPVKPDTFAQVLPMLAEPMTVGDKLDVKTGEVIKKPVDPIIIDPVLEIDPVLDIKP